MDTLYFFSVLWRFFFLSVAMPQKTAFKNKHRTLNKKTENHHQFTEKPTRINLITRCMIFTRVKTSYGVTGLDLRVLWNKCFNNLRFLTNRGELESYRTWVYTLQHDSACRNQPTKGVSHPLSLSQVQLHCCNMFSVTTPTHCQVLYGLSEENFCYTKCSNWKQTKFYFNSWLVRKTKIST